MEEMKIAKAYLRYVRIAPRKVQIVCDLIRGKDAGTAMAILMQTPKAASEPLMKLLKSACANAENNFGMDPAKLVVSEVFATPGPILKRAAEQIAAGATYLDVNIGPAEKDGPERMMWAVQLLQQNFNNVPLALDTDRKSVV